MLQLRVPVPQLQVCWHKSAVSADLMPSQRGRRGVGASPTTTTWNRTDKELETEGFQI